MTKVSGANQPIFNYRDKLTVEERLNIDSLKSRMGDPIRINLAIFLGEEFVGWSWGFQQSSLDFYMCNSAILPAHRKKGLYSALLKQMVNRVKSFGFQRIYSRHTMTNNEILIPKLKAGFVMTGFEVSDVFGVLVQLSYFPNKLRRKVLDYRVGQIKVDQELKEIFDYTQPL